MTVETLMMEALPPVTFPAKRRLCWSVDGLEVNVLLPRVSPLNWKTWSIKPVPPKPPLLSVLIAVPVPLTTTLSPLVDGWPMIVASPGPLPPGCSRSVPPCSSKVVDPVEAKPSAVGVLRVT